VKRLQAQKKPNPRVAPSFPDAAEAAKPSERLRQWQSVAILALLAICCYGNSLGNSFHYDDIHSILENDSVRTLQPQRVWNANSRTRFLTMYSFSLNYAAQGFDTLWGWHAVNIGVHFLCGLLIYALALRLNLAEAKRPAALLAAAVFLAHPLATEPVNYIQARGAQLALLFPLASAFFLTGYLRRRSLWTFGLFAVCAVLGCLSKEVGAYYVIAIPLLCVLVCRKESAGLSRALRRPLYGVLAGGVLLLAIVFAHFTGILHNVLCRLGEVPYGPYVLRESGALFSYLRLMFLPYHLAADHFVMPGSQPLGVLTCVLAGANLLLLAAAIGLWKRCRILSFAILWVLAMHLPYQLIPGPELMVEYRAYPMLVGFAIAVSWALVRLPGTERSRLLAAGALLLVFVSLTINRNMVWRDGLTLWTDCLERNASNPRAHNNLGNAYLREGRIEDARQAFLRAQEIMPGVAEVHHNLGALYIKEKKYEEAIRELRQAVARKPDLARAHNGLGTALALAKRFDAAIASFQEALRLNPYYIQARNGLGNAYAGKRQYDRAIAEYRAVLDWGIESPEVYRNLADAYRGRGDVEQAITYYRKAMSLAPDTPAVHTNLGNAYKDRGEIEQAIAEYRRAIELDPNDAMAHNNLGSALLLQRQFAQAEKHLRLAVEKDPRYASAYCNLGSLMHLTDRPARAEDHYRDAIRLDRNYADAWYNLGIVLRRQGRTQEALEAYREAVRIKPDSAAAHAAVGLLYLELGQREKARASLLAAVQRDPRMARRKDVAKALREAGKR